MDKNIQKAVAYFKQGDYLQAKLAYQQAQSKYGAELFAGCVRLCDLRMKSPITEPNLGEPRPMLEKVDCSSDDLALQLTKTQNLLEHYFAKCAELECQIMDQTK